MNKLNKNKLKTNINCPKFGQTALNLGFYTFSVNALVCRTSVYNCEIVSACLKKLLRFEKSPPTLFQPSPFTYNKQDSFKTPKRKIIERWDWIILEFQNKNITFHTDINVSCFHPWNQQINHMVWFFLCDFFYCH